MLSAHAITFATLVFGPIIAILFLIWYRLAIGRWGTTLSFALGAIANGLSVVPLICVIWNVIRSAYLASFDEAQYAKLASSASSIEGSETTIFLALLYAILMMFYAVHRAIAEQRLIGSSSTQQSNHTPRVG